MSPIRLHMPVVFRVQGSGFRVQDGGFGVSHAER